MQNQSQEGYLEGGFEERYVVERLDGAAIPAEARFIILDYSGRDPHAIKALRVYADSVQNENPKFAEDIRKALDDPNSYPAQHR